MHYGFPTARRAIGRDYGAQLKASAQAMAVPPHRVGAPGVEHVPLPAWHWLAGVSMFVIRSQDAAGHEGVVQQTPSTQLPDAQSAGPPQS